MQEIDLDSWLCLLTKTKIKVVSNNLKTQKCHKERARGLEKSFKKPLVTLKIILKTTWPCWQHLGARFFNCWNGFKICKMQHRECITFAHLHPEIILYHFDLDNQLKTNKIVSLPRFQFQMSYQCHKWAKIVIESALEGKQRQFVSYGSVPQFSLQYWPQANKVCPLFLSTNNMILPGCAFSSLFFHW